MNKKFIVISLLSLIIGSVYADNKFTAVTPQEVPQGERGNLIINYNFDNEGDFSAYSLQLVLPEGVTMIDEGEGYEVVGGNCNSNSHGYAVNLYEGVYYLTCSSTQSAPFKGTSGVLMTIPVNVSNELELNKEYPVQIKNVKISYLNATSISMDDVDFNIKVVAPLVLDENSTEDIAETSVKTSFTVKRTIKANEWSTLCLPFDMTNAQVLEAFGSDVQFAELKAKDANLKYYVVETDDAGNIISITIPFVTSDIEEGIFANSPYLIKTSKDISSFKVSAQITPEEAETYCTNGKYGANKETYVTFTGVYKAGGFVPTNSLFLADNVFWYSTGKTKIKAFRAYFTLQDVLSSVENANAKISFSINDEATSIDGINSYRVAEGVYDLSGRKIQLKGNDLNKLQKGVYIIDGKKVTIK